MGKIYWSKVILYLLAAIAFVAVFGACGSKKNLKDTKEMYAFRFDSVNVKETIDRNKAINDGFFKYIGAAKTAKPECDSITQAYLIDVLRSLNTKKTSGENQWGFHYDESKKQFVAYANLAETVNREKASVQLKTTVTTIIIAKEVPVKWMPWYIIALAGIGGATVAFLGYKLTRFIVRPRIPIIS